MGVQRFECDDHPGNPNDGGEWVKATDHAATVAEKDARIAELEDWMLRAGVILEEIKRREAAPYMDNSGTPFMPRPMQEGRKSSVETRRPAAWWDELRSLRAALTPRAEGGRDE